MNKIKYRPEIDGLRALSVVFVMLFHADFTIFRGGFIGVDIFFVISGYLITSIILAEKKSGTFSLSNFYERRARRILPALFFIVLICFLVSYYILIPAQFVDLAKASIAITFFVSNIFFWLSGGYFGAPIEINPLIHTWSLAVEEQFYLLFPLLMMLFSFKNKMLFTLVIVFLAFLSLVISEFGWRYYSLLNFYFLASRALELLIGVLCALYLFNKDEGRGNEVLSFLGIILIVLSVLLFDKNTPFPSILALIPTLGCALIILFCTKGTLVSYVLSNKILVGIGLISYSTYLWHQPLFVFSRLKGITPDLENVVMIILIFISLFLGYLTWKFIEQPFRKKSVVGTKNAVICFTVLFIVINLMSFIVIFNNGFIHRYPIENHNLALISYDEQEKYAQNKFNSLRRTEFLDNSLKDMLIIGDSYAQDLINAFDEGNILDQFNVSTYYISKRCGNLFIKTDFSDKISIIDRNYCRHRNLYNDERLKKLISQSDIIFLASSWQDWVVDLLSESIKNIRETSDAKIIVIGRKDFGLLNINNLLGLTAKDKGELRSLTSLSHRQVNERMREIFKKDIFIDTHMLLCGEGSYCPVFTRDLKLISHDGSHLTKDGAKFLGERLLQNTLFNSTIIENKN